MRFFAIRNWQKFQHYKKRNPPWIKLYVSLLHDPEMATLPDGAWRLLITIWMLTARTGTWLPLRHGWIMREAGLRPTRYTGDHFDVLISRGFLSVVASKTIPSETETETETETDKTIVANSPKASTRRGPGGGTKPRTRTKTTPGFDAAWVFYPHFERRSSKRKAAEVWGKLGLEFYPANVLAWITAERATDDWKREGGQFVPGFEVWLKKHDFSEPPASLVAAKSQPPTDAEFQAAVAERRARGMS